MIEYSANNLEEAKAFFLENSKDSIECWIGDTGKECHSYPEAEVFYNGALEIDNPETYPANGPSQGLKFRDHVAAKAMQGILSNAGTMTDLTSEWKKTVGDTFEGFPDLVAGIAYEYADAMLKARAKPREE